ncbi:MAG: S41 family peptidase [Cytophagales bacterium]|nr:S41 family peptidase [Cytophagales bacterium]MDW8383321.1 S41 family peptidase [Flammeovirgaceae bacterium]
MSFRWVRTTMLALAGTGLFLLFSFQSPFVDKYFEIVKNLEIFASVYKELNRYYVDELNPSEVIGGGIEGMLYLLDPYTTFFSEDEVEDFRTETTGKYGEIGVDIMKNSSGKIMIYYLLKNSPAEKAGLKIGDEILQIDGLSLQNKNVHDINNLLRGQVGTKVELLIRKNQNQSQKILKISLTREHIKTSCVSHYEIVKDDIGIVQLKDFNPDASKEVKQAILDLTNKGAKKIILDLRDNPGGLLSEAVNIINLFLPKGTDVVSVKGRTNEWNKTHKALNQPLDVEIPLAVLVNEQSASASEIVSGVLQDYDRAVIIGKRTFGKGLVQSTFSLPYNAKIKITVARYYIPSGRCIQKINYSNKDETSQQEKSSTVFRTKNGRIVDEKGGILPDILTTTPKEPLELIDKLTKELVITDFVLEFIKQKPAPQSPEHIVFTDKDYEEFKKWVTPKLTECKIPIEETVQELDTQTTQLQSEWVKKELSLQVEALKNKINDIKIRLLDENKRLIIKAIKNQIALYYFYEVGKSHLSLLDDEDVTKAIEILSDSSKYYHILNPKKQ